VPVHSEPGGKEAAYGELAGQVAAVLEGELHPVSRMATLAALLHHRFDRFFWTGFYIVDPDRPNELVIGPYQGSVGCLRIPFGKGVCGAAAASRETQIVPDVHAFPDHIACDSRSNSEIVLPVCTSQGELIGVLDIDSTEFDAFDEVDARCLERILAETFSADSQKHETAGPSAMLQS